MRKISKIERLLWVGLVVFLVANAAFAASVLFPYQGGTGNGTGPAKGTLLVGSSTSAYARVVVGTNGLVLTASSTAPYGVSWEAITIPGSIGTSSPVTIGYFPYWASVTGLNGTSSIFQSGTSVGVGTTQPSSTLHVVGSGTFTTTLTVAGAQNNSSTLNVENNTQLRGTLNVTGAVNNSSTLVNEGAGTFRSTLTVTGAQNNSSTLNVENNTQLRGTLNVTGAQNNSSTLTVENNAVMRGTLNVSGAVNNSSTLTQEGTAAFRGAVLASSSLTVQGNFQCRGTCTNAQGDNLTTSTAANLTGGAAGTSTVNGVLNTFARSDSIRPIASQYASTTISIPIINATTTNPSWVQFGPFPFTFYLTQIDCAENAGTTTLQIDRGSAMASTTVGTNITTSTVCNAVKNTVTLFASSTFPAGSFANVTVTSTAGTPVETVISLTGNR